MLRIRQPIPDNYDPEMPWLVEADTIGELMADPADKDRWLRENIHGQVKIAGRVIGFADYQDALMFYLRFFVSDK